MCWFKFKLDFFPKMFELNGFLGATSNDLGLETVDDNISNNWLRRGFVSSISVFSFVCGDIFDTFSSELSDSSFSSSSLIDFS